MDHSIRSLARQAATAGSPAQGSMSTAAAGDLQVGDAYVRRGADGQSWTIGNGAMEQVLTSHEGRFRLTSLKNKLTNPIAEYVSEPTAGAPFGLFADSFTGRYILEELWRQNLGAEGTVDFAQTAFSIVVKKGDLIGFSVSSLTDDTKNELEWPTILQYADGERYSSLDNPDLAQGPIWYHYIHGTGTGCLDAMDEIVEPNKYNGLKEKRRAAVGYRAPWEAPIMGTSTMLIMNSFNIIRAWRAPKDGTVTVQGEAKLVTGPGASLRIVKIEEKAIHPIQLSPDRDAWALKEGEGQLVNAGGRPAVQLDLTLQRDNLRAKLHIVAYPGASVMRQWVELENIGSTSQTLQSPTPLSIVLNSQNLPSTTRHFLYGGTSRPNQGVLHTDKISLPYHEALLGEKTDNYTSWMALQRQAETQDGWFVALDYLGTWVMSLDAEAQGPALLNVSLPSLADYPLATGERLQLPLITLGVYQKDLDDMGQRVYDWQYEYLWDYTNPEFYAQPKWAVPWFSCSFNLQEQFTARLANLDMDADLMRAAGFTLLWDDAGWSKYPGWPVPDNYGAVFNPSHEGPDYAQTLDYLEKMDIKWLGWFGGHPRLGIMKSKAGAWGDYQYRSDGVGTFNLPSDQKFRREVENFLTLYPRCSVHTCDGGSRYAHEFEIQRYADVNFLSDLGRGPETNYYFSYLEAPDKWCDILEPLMNEGCKYNLATSRHMLTMTPNWFCYATPEDQERLRLDVQIYHYLLRQGVAGRWSYVFHPAVTGDDPTYYFQRSNHQRTKACIILKHQAEGEVTIRPAGLLPELEYVVGFDTTTATTTRTGSDLMANGITIKNQAPGELIYLNLPDRPGSGLDKSTPQAPGRVLTRREVNIGFCGIGVYWSTPSEDHWISYYEVQRNGKTLGKVSAGAYYFDRSAEADLAATYSVRTVDGNGNTSAWTNSSASVPGEPLTITGLAGHYPEAGRDGWSAETTKKFKTYEPMTFVKPVKSPAGDLGGTPNQVGGVEGYWEGAEAARIGRGWQQPSKDAACVRTWIAPKDGRIRVIGRAMKECYRQDKGNALRVRILLRNRRVWPKEDWAQVPLNDLIGAKHDLMLRVKAGDPLRFVLDRSNDPEMDILAWMPQIVYSEKTKTEKLDKVRILCGARRGYKDQNGNSWSSDRFFTGGEAMKNRGAIQGSTPTEQDEALYQAGRKGKDFSYAIPLKPGLYSVRLKFAEPTNAWWFERPMNVDINGHRVLSDYDVCAMAKGWLKAHERTFRNLVPNEKGEIKLRFTSGFAPGLDVQPDAMVQAIEVLPEVTAQPQRIDVGSTEPFIDWAGAIWDADKVDESAPDKFIQSSNPVQHASPTLYDQSLYQTARTGRKIELSLKAAPGLYTVHLKFAEMWLKEKGQRPMNIEINGQCFWKNWDPSAEAEMVNMAMDLRAEAITPDSKGQIKVTISACGENDAILQGLEIK